MPSDDQSIMLAAIGGAWPKEALPVVARAKILGGVNVWHYNGEYINEGAVPALFCGSGLAWLMTYGESVAGSIEIDRLKDGTFWVWHGYTVKSEGPTLLAAIDAAVRAVTKEKLDA